LPFGIVHLLGQRGDDFAVGPVRLGDQSVTGGAQLGLFDVRGFGLHAPGYRFHERLPALVDLRRSENQARTVAARWEQGEVCIEALARAELVRSNLMTDGA